MNPEVLVVEDDDALREALCETLAMAGLRARAAEDGQAALEIIQSDVPGIVVSDVKMRPMDGLSLLGRIQAEHPELPVILMTAYATVDQAVRAMRQGAVDYLVKPFEAEVLISRVSEHLPQEPDSEGPVAVDPASRQLLSLAGRVAASDATVLITGVSGVGKEVLARYIHRHSPRSSRPFVAVNCAAIPDNMLEAVMFGYEKGAFTGAYKSSPGKFEQAQGGTLLLDEISEMALGLQAKLLRVLQEQEVERLGGQQLVPLDVRVLATTNRDMRSEVAEGNFREDLYYRLNVFPLHMPSLAERPLDILPLAEFLLQRLATRQGRPAPSLSSAARIRLQGHPWPGNVRELDNVMQRAMILQSGSIIQDTDVHFESTAAPGPDNRFLEQAPGQENEDRILTRDLRHRESELIAAALEEGNGSRKAAAEKLGISPRTLRYKLQKLREAGIAL